MSLFGLIMVNSERLSAKILHVIKAYPMWASFTALKYKELGLLISAREVGLPISLILTDSVKH